VYTSPRANRKEERAIRYFEEIERPDDVRRRPPGKPKPEHKTVEEALLVHLDPLIRDHLITEVIRPIKSGKEAIVYCCRAHESLGRELAAAKVYRPYESRSFKNDKVYQQGRERGSRPDARTLRALGKKTRRGRLHKFNAWISHEERTLDRLRKAGADVPELIDRVGPVILMEYLGNQEDPAPVLLGVDLDPGEAGAIYERLLWNVDLFLKNHRVHADLSAYNILYWEGRAVIIDFPQAVDPRYNDDAFDLLVRDLGNLNAYFADTGVELVDPLSHALALWRTHVDPLR
jgi:RIO kinase 1